MMQQYEDAKAACGEALLLFRMGDFYELFYEDAKVAAKAVGLTLTSRDKGENPIPMAGFPHHQLDSYLGKLIQAGFRAAVCEQMEDPRQAKGIVKREITRVVTPGTLTDDALLDPRESNYLAAIAHAPASRGEATGQIGLAWAELSTGRFEAAVIQPNQLEDHLARIAPSECLVQESENSLDQANGVAVTTRPDWAFAADTAESVLAKHFGTHSLDGFGFDHAADRSAIRAAGAIIDYLLETQKSSLDHLDRLIPYRTGTTLEIDESTRRSLELNRTLRHNQREGSLLWVLDRCVTPMGSRLLADWLANPLTCQDSINSRLDAVTELRSNTEVCRQLVDQMRQVYDLQRLLARVSTGRASPRDLAFVGKTLGRIPELKAQLSQCSCPRLVQLDQELDPCSELRELLSESLADDCPIAVKDGGFIRAGYHAELDRLRTLAAGGKQWIAEYQQRESETSQIPNLKVGYNKVFGYYIEVTNAHRDKIPDTFIRKQTLKNAERYITPELKEYEEQVVTADEKSRDLEYELFLKLRDEVHRAAPRLQAISRSISEIDVFCGLALLARDRNYCRPEVVESPELEILEGKHPVLDITEPEGSFVPNDTINNAEDGTVLLITGPNMAGKSTYIRQVALLAIMAQMGSHVPARQARIGIADHVFARVGASDELSRGQSTFMVEMTETARILHTATSRSLVILDEIGRGTSTYDGVSLAWAILEHIHEKIGCRTLFATHYHELTDLQHSLEGMRNLNVAVKEWQDHVVFLHKIVPGAADKSYGIHVARLAGVPSEVNERAKQILAQLEDEHLDEKGRPRIAVESKSRGGDLQLTLFATQEHPLLDKIRELNSDELTPIEALQLIHEWQQQLVEPQQRKPR